MHELRKFNIDRDYETLCQWHEMYGIRPPQPENISKFGVVVEGVAAGFLLKTDTCTALLEGFIANPESWDHERDEALDKIAEGLIEEALKQGFKNIVCFTKLPAIVKRAQKFGLKEIGDYKLLSRGL